MHQSKRLRWLGAVFALVSVVSIALVGSPALAEGTVYPVANGVVVYESPSDAAPAVAILTTGNALVSHGSRGEWLSVDLTVDGESQTGWVRSRDVGTTPAG